MSVMLQKIKQNIFFGLMVCVGAVGFNGAAFGMQHLLGQQELLSAWGAKGSMNWKYCQDHKIASGDEPCIGVSAKTCANPKSDKSPAKGDEYEVLLMMPFETSEHGSKFCPMAVIAGHDYLGLKRTFTMYAWAGTEADCVWLCSEGWTGTRCMRREKDVESCDSSLLFRSNFDSLQAVGIKKYTDAANIEDQIANLGANVHDEASFKSCYNPLAEDEYDITVIISGWTQSGHGAFVRPYILRSTSNIGSVSSDSWIALSPAATGGINNSAVAQNMLACKNGYKPNASKTDCVEIKEGMCDCVAQLTEAGATPNEAADICKNGKQYDKNTMIYGPGSKQDVFGDQCWIKSSVSDYKSCIKNSRPNVKGGFSYLK